MIANSRCIACNLSKKEEKIRKHSDEKKKKEFIQKVTGILYKYGDIESTPMLGWIKEFRTFIMNIMKRKRIM